MEKNLFRSLTVLADGEQVTGFCYARLTGREALGLLPLPYTLRLLNLPDSGTGLLYAARNLSVLRDGSLLAWGRVSAVLRRTVPEGKLTEVVFSPGLPLWEAPVSLSVEAGVSVSETLRRILAASGMGISLLAFPGPDPVRTRGQAFYGRAAECAEEALSAVPARACLSPAGLRVIPAEGLPVSLYLTDRDLIDAPSFTDGQMILRTTVTGWPVGERISVKWKDGSAEGLVTERRMDIDTLNGKWESMLLISLKADRQRQMQN